MSKMIESDRAYAEGYNAGLDEGYGYTAECPYDVDTEERKRWDVGLRDGRFESRCQRGSE